MRTSLVLAVFLGCAPLAAVGSFAHDSQDPPGPQAPIKPDEVPTIPMNPQDPTFDDWKRMRKDLSKGRQPGPIDVQRFPGGTGWQGIPTFFRRPVALTPEDLQVGKVEVAMLGAYTDMGFGYRGAAYGPSAFRHGPDYVAWGDWTTPHGHTMVDPFRTLAIVDYGDAPVDLLSVERSVHAIRDMVREIASVEIEPGKRVIPVVIGGDHSLMYPDVAALSDVYGKGNVGVIHFDAHYDAGKTGFGHLINHGMPVYRLIKEGHVPGKNFVQVGLRGFWPGKLSFEWMRREGFRYHTMAEIEKRGWDPVMEDVLREAKDGPQYLFISFDIDVMDPAFTPGTGSPEPGGLTSREVFPLVRRLCAESNVVGFELVELLPYRDPGYTTVLNANRVVRECLTGLAMRKLGLTGTHYLDPLTVDDGRR